ncbi:uncharacterized protein LAESUDRAFT_531548 [Laetiporus sulphureus 93-53]|uniref:Uncharacterized protein n=1 Tax=Laetiporus sulphureus 93-53 TaxID=1314785 RepID=A0A165BB18_9APHY|nr:uncharacterized protein LAESUDRAFT_531548 [Laetiporus sulphureus 93-53]KZT00651.1 hypothetical protein LAESUDRAFT_531548 [Laetiporus sulphureus 93-53]
MRPCFEEVSVHSMLEGQLDCTWPMSHERLAFEPVMLRGPMGSANQGAPLRAENLQSGLFEGSLTQTAGVVRAIYCMQYAGPQSCAGVQVPNQQATRGAQSTDGRTIPVESGKRNQNPHCEIVGECGAVHLWKCRRFLDFLFPALVFKLQASKEEGTHQVTSCSSSPVLRSSGKTSQKENSKPFCLLYHDVVTRIPGELDSRCIHAQSQHILLHCENDAQTISRRPPGFIMSHSLKYFENLSDTIRFPSILRRVERLPMGIHFIAMQHNLLEDQCHFRIATDLLDVSTTISNHHKHAITLMRM